MEGLLLEAQAALEGVEGLPWHGRQDSALDCAGAPSSPRMSATEAFSPSRVWVGVYEPGPGTSIARRMVSSRSCGSIDFN